MASSARRAAERAFSHAGIRPDDVDVLELYDPFSFEIIRQLEAFGFCGDGEGGPFVADGHIAIDGSHPITTDGGTMSFSHAGANPQMMQRAIRAVQQLRGEAGDAAGARRAYRVLQQRGSGRIVHHGADPGRRAAMTAESLQPQTGPLPHASSHAQRAVLAGMPIGGAALSALRWRAAWPTSRRPSTAANAFRPNCGGRTSGGVGEIYSWTVVYRPVTPEFEPPYAPAIITLDEGYQMLTNIVGCGPRRSGDRHAGARALPRRWPGPDAARTSPARNSRS